MARSVCYLFVFPLTCFALGSWAQRSPYSLQTAVDELNHWDAAKFPLNAPPAQPGYYRSALGGSASDQDYWDDDFVPNSNRNRQRLKKELAKYLERENYNSNNNEQEGLSLGLAPFDDFKSNNFWSKQKDQKRGTIKYFRQQAKTFDNAPTSVFRERDSQAANGNTELTQQFLREIDEAQEREREQRYKSALRNLLDNYEPQQNDVDNKLFDEQKRMRVPPYYMLMQKKRSYPVLPWLPYNTERKKRFPVTKRSTKRTSSIDNGSLDKTDEKVEKELSELFGISNTDAKKKRSTDDQTKTTENTPTALSTAMSDMRLEMPAKTETNATEVATKMPEQTKEHQHAGHNHAAHESHGGHQHEHKHNKRSNHHSGEDDREHESEEEEEEDSEEHGEHDEHEDEEDDEDFGDEEDEERKKKRDVSNVKQLLPSSDNIMKRKKKSIQWSKYFGIDRKKKAFKRSTSQEDDKNTLSSDKLNNMDKKLQSIEDMIIDETIKYTGAHEGK